MSPIAAVIERARQTRTFPGASVYFERDDERGHAVLEVASGRLTYDENAPRVTPDTLYDLASLTKLFTLTAFVLVARQQNIDVDAPLCRFLPTFDSSDKREITLRQLMRHNSGISFAIQELSRAPAEMWQSRVCETPLHSAPGEKVLYSCTNFWLLARVLEIVGGATLDDVTRATILEPLHLTRTTLVPLQLVSHHEIAPTEVEPDAHGDGVAVCGVVHDEAARAWQAQTQTCAGNAGLFGTAREVAAFARMWLRDGEDILRFDEVQRALEDITPESACFRAWGWQYDNRTFAPPHSYGHAGFTGPTLWLNVQRRELGVILNNRVFPTRHGPHRMPYHRELNKLFLDEDFED